MRLAASMMSGHIMSCALLDIRSTYYILIILLHVFPCNTYAVLHRTECNKRSTLYFILSISSSRETSSCHTKVTEKLSSNSPGRLFLTNLNWFSNEELKPIVG